MSAAFDIIAILFGLTALFAYVNHKVIKLPMTVGMLLIGLELAVPQAVLPAEPG